MEKETRGGRKKCIDRMGRIEEPPTAFVVLLYMKGVTERLQKAYKQHNIQLVWKAGYTIRNVVVYPKDPLDPGKNVV